MHHCTDEKKPTGDGNPTAGGTDRAIVPDTTSTCKITSRKTGHRLLALNKALNELVLRVWCATPSSWGRGTIRLKPKGPVPEKHLWFSGCSPHRQAGFCFVQILGTGAPALAPHSFGRDGPTRKDGRTAEPVFFTSRPPTALKTQTVVLKSRSGAKTMTTSQMASRSAAPTLTPTTGNTTHLDPVALHFEAVNACAMARWYAARHRHTEAARKLRQGLAALRRLQALEVAA